MQLEQLYKHPLALSRAHMASARSYVGDRDRVLKFCDKLLSGQAVKIVLMGGSWTSGSGVENSANSWVPKFLGWVNETFPNPNHAFLNQATRGVTSGFFAPCLQTLVPPDTDLVLLEYDVNDGYYEFTESLLIKDTRGWWVDHIESPARRTFERILRQLMGMPTAPAIIYMHAWEGYRNHSNYYWGVEDKYDTILKFYGLPSLSMRNSLHYYLKQHPEMLWMIWTEWDTHPTCLGTRMFSDMLIGYLMDNCAEALLATTQHGTHTQRISRLSSHLTPHHHHHPPLPAPLFSDNYNRISSKCFMNDVQMQPIITQSQGYDWVNEGTDSNPRWGFRSTYSGDYMTLKVDHSIYDKYNDTLVVGFSLLTSYEKMGMLEVSCWEGCTCATRSYETCNTDISWSEARWAFIETQVTSPEEACIIHLVTSSKPSACTGNKVKILATMLTAVAEVAEGSASVGLPPIYDTAIA